MTTSRPTPAPNTRRPSTRYGDTAATNAGSGIGGKVLAIALVVIVLLIAVAFARNMIQRQAIPVKATFITQEAIDDATTRLWIDVTRKDPAVESYCIVTALAYDFSEVGRREIAIPAGGDTLSRVQIDVPVRAPAVSGRVYGCSTQIPFYLDTSESNPAAR